MRIVVLLVGGLLAAAWAYAAVGPAILPITVTPISFQPSALDITDNSPAGALVASGTVLAPPATISSCTPACGGVFALSGSNLVLARDLTSSDDGQDVVTVRDARGNQTTVGVRVISAAAGAPLEEAAGSGTPAGTYSDFLIKVVPNNTAVSPACFRPSLSSSGAGGPVTLSPVPCS